MDYREGVAGGLQNGRGWGGGGVYKVVGEGGSQVLPLQKGEGGRKKVSACERWRVLKVSG